MAVVYACQSQIIQVVFAIIQDVFASCSMQQVKGEVGETHARPANSSSDNGTPHSMLKTSWVSTRPIRTPTPSPHRRDERFTSLMDQANQFVHGFRFGIGNFARQQMASVDHSASLPAFHQMRERPSPP